MPESAPSAVQLPPRAACCHATQAQKQSCARHVAGLLPTQPRGLSSSCVLRTTGAQKNSAQSPSPFALAAPLSRGWPRWVVRLVLRKEAMAASHTVRTAWSSCHSTCGSRAPVNADDQIFGGRRFRSTGVPHASTRPLHSRGCGAHRTQDSTASNGQLCERAAARGQHFRQSSGSMQPKPGQNCTKVVLSGISTRSVPPSPAELTLRGLFRAFGFTKEATRAAPAKGRS